MLKQMPCEMSCLSSVAWYFLLLLGVVLASPDLMLMGSGT